MNIKQTKVVLKCLIENKVPITTMLWSRPGLGKTSIVEDLARELNYKCIVITLSQRESTDLLGMPYIAFDDILKASVSDFHLPRWFLEAIRQGNVILFLDELNRARKEVINAAFELILSRRLNMNKLPDSVHLIAASNSAVDGRNDVIEFDEATIDRMMHLHVQPDTDCWLEWARNAKNDGGKNRIHSHVTNFISLNQDALFCNDTSLEFPVTLRQTARSWERVSMIYELKDLPDGLKTECIKGIVGPELAVAFFKSINDIDKPFSADEICQLSEETLDRIDRYVNGTPKRLDVLNASLANIHDLISADNEKALKYADNILKVISLIPADQALDSLRRIYQKEGWSAKLLKNPEMKKRLQSYSAVLRQAETLSEEKKKPSKSSKNSQQRI